VSHLRIYPPHEKGKKFGPIAVENSKDHFSPVDKEGDGPHHLRERRSEIGLSRYIVFGGESERASQPEHEEVRGNRDRSFLLGRKKNGTRIPGKMKSKGEEKSKIRGGRVPLGWGGKGGGLSSNFRGVELLGKKALQVGIPRNLKPKRS